MILKKSYQYKNICRGEMKILFIAIERFILRTSQYQFILRIG